MNEIRTPSPKPIVVIICPPEDGHTRPLLPHATHLIKQGYVVHFIGGVNFEEAIRSTGATYHHVPSVLTAEQFQQQQALEGPAQFIFGIKHNFIDLTPVAMKALQRVLETIREENPEREVVILQEFVSMAVWPFLLGAPLPKGYNRFPKVITLSTVPLTVSSIDTAPFGPGLPPDSSDEGRNRNAAMYQAMEGIGAELIAYADAVYSDLGATSRIPTKVLMDFWATGADLLLQPCSPSLEYPRSDLSPKIRFIGAMPPPPLAATIALPAWWGELVAAKQATPPKKVVFVTQGTFILDYRMLLIPTIQALAGNDQYLVVAVLGKKGAALDDDVKLPENAKVVDYLSYDAILPYADVFVTNGGYGGFLHGVMHGVPMVIAGTGQDKAEVSMRGEWAGIAANLRSNTPSIEDIREGVTKVIGDDRFKRRCLAIKQENEDLACFAQVERYINEIV
ncbi:UDP-Glycosyltransferase/glycogen phosphorylase [Aspergillus homomorphus CBS 101889]|uniref:UDP-Glycosyltransferase/glycogen phosphorylase n=1 Tax=Aspergillus homomorphus (strain CBS 101889) TaxID=1450537 RepID=A0A395HZE4_ASPHC|nr:UDP-Glycosyltransferase/glycogen phosphorylase [Aspergillus homomorphus CBS 101889]RAL13302.1 UDP-Glycosyltransferase/glycogen phosphorylase [Aspergillus homomorphus CBS 101889]